MTIDRSYIGYLGFLGIDLFKSVLMYSNGAFASLNYFLIWAFLQCTSTGDLYFQSYGWPLEFVISFSEEYI
jgi:hypothetical protein